MIYIGKAIVTTAKSADYLGNAGFGLDPAVATVIAQIACHENALPQGSPCSPVISNLVANILDARLLRLAKASGCTFTRYADDLTFSTNKTIFPSEIAKELAGAEWEVGKQLQDLIERSGYTLNIAKTRMSLRQSRQTVTGLVVNEKPNISQDYYRCVRAMCHSVFTTGSWYSPVQTAGAVPVPTASLRPVEGMLSHIYFVKARRDRSHKMNKDAGFISPKTPTRLYKEFRKRRLRPIEFQLSGCGDVMKRRAVGSSSGTTRRGPYAPSACCA
jgi:hypothetical protein